MRTRDAAGQKKTRKPLLLPDVDRTMEPRGKNENSVNQGGGMSEQERSAPESGQSARRGFLQHVGVTGAVALGLTGCGAKPAPASGGRPKLRAAFSNAGLQSTWCELGRQTAMLWGEMLDVQVEWFDGEFDAQKQRDKFDALTQRQWDFVCVQAVKIDSLAEPVRELKKRGIPVISMDTLLVDPAAMRDTGVWIQVQPDQVFMGESSTQYLMRKIQGKGKVVHIGGLSAHSGAVGRRVGFERVLREFPNVQVVGGGIRWCDWEKAKARNTFEALLQQEKEPIAGAFFHSDDMALACIPYAKEHPIHKDMIFTAVDGQKEGLAAVRAGQLSATTVNPVCLIHRTALIIGQFIARNQEAMDTLPLEIITPGPLVSLESGNLQSMEYLADPKHCMV